jgi:hypothetical protein
MMTGKKLLRAAVLTTLILGCGGGGGAPVTEAEFCKRLSEAECQVTARCVSDMMACTDERKALCEEFARTAKMSMKRVFTPGNVNACVDKTRAVYSKATITPQDMADMADACNYVFQGTGEVLIAECDVKYDCKGKVICDKGFCANASTKPVGQGCTDSGDVCAAGSYCAPNASNNLVCTAKGMTGATCNATTPCLEALRCSNGTCADRVPGGMPCTSNDDCATAAPYCDPFAGNRCGPGLTFATNSLSCADYGGTASTGAGGSGGAGGGAAGSGGSGGGAAGSGGSGGGAAGSGGTGGGAAGTGGSGAAGTGGAGGN